MVQMEREDNIVLYVLMVKDVLKMYKNKMVKHLVLICVLIVDTQVIQHTNGNHQNLNRTNVGVTQLMNDVSFYDEEREIMWFPSVLNMGDLGVIYPEGSKNNWVYKLTKLGNYRVGKERF